jgi:hypothetical protein
VDRRDLRRRLVAAGVPDGVYEIAGEHEPVPPAPDFVFLRPDRGRGRSRRWEVGVYERGRHTVSNRYPTEDAGCRALWRLLTGKNADG